MSAQRIAILLLFGTWSTASAEEHVSQQELSRMIRGKAATIANDRIHYGADGLSNINEAKPGRYRVEGSSICIRFEQGDDRCDQIRKDGERYVLITADGQRYPFRPD